MNEEARLGMEPPVKMRTRTDTHSSESILEYGLASEVNEPSPPSLKGGKKNRCPFPFCSLFIFSKFVLDKPGHLLCKRACQFLFSEITNNFF